MTTVPRRPADDVPPPAAPPVCARCGHQGPLNPPTTGLGHWPSRTGAGVVFELVCKVPGCSCRVHPVNAEWWRP